jgi:hypothetical protein
MPILLPLQKVTDTSLYIAEYLNRPQTTLISISSTQVQVNGRTTLVTN